MHQKLSSFMKNDNIIVKSILCDKENRDVLESFGIFEGVRLQILYRNSANMILKIGKTKLVISKKIAENILAISENESNRAYFS